MKVLDELTEGKYMRTMVAAADSSGNNNRVVSFGFIDGYEKLFVCIWRRFSQSVLLTAVVTHWVLNVGDPMENRLASWDTCAWNNPFISHHQTLMNFFCAVCCQFLVANEPVLLIIWQTSVVEIVWKQK